MSLSYGENPGDANFLDELNKEGQSFGSDYDDSRNGYFGWRLTTKGVTLPGNIAGVESALMYIEFTPLDENGNYDQANAIKKTYMVQEI